ncbi:hypothetical protein ACIGNX_06795 [Actinosynnema sp. NPDC053489]|uniref:hypothetical protein n=1 Tax=Actinosynnema sp. NPDC053489 TaxID=3363916 RepID=UPI0037C6FD8B
MTVLLQLPGTVLLQVARSGTAKLRELLVAHLTRPSAGPRHRVLTPWQIRRQRWKSALVHHLSTDPRPAAVPRPRTAAGPPDPPPRVPALSTRHAPPRTAQHPKPAWAVQEPRPPRARPYALPNDLWSTEPLPRTIAWPPPEPAETRLTGNLEEPTVTDDQPTTPELQASEPQASEPEVWEFEVGDLARWWDEAIARLDAAAAEAKAHNHHW